ncbi:unnamed protein product [Colias eurytheme]|nr:unnamed protein product [Colias eurytheme]
MRQKSWKGINYVKDVIKDVCAILLLGDNNYRPNIVIASTYMPADEDPPPREFARLVEYCAGEGLELIAGTDCNAHHPLWGMPTGNNRGRDLVEYLFTTSLNLVNTGAEPTFVTRRCRTIIDLTLATPGIIDSINNWHVSKEASCSDHSRDTARPQTSGNSKARGCDVCQYDNRISSYCLLPPLMQQFERYMTCLFYLLFVHARDVGVRATLQDYDLRLAPLAANND